MKPSLIILFASFMCLPAIYAQSITLEPGKSQILTTGPNSNINYYFSGPLSISNVAFINECYRYDATVTMSGGITIFRSNSIMPPKQPDLNNIPTQIDPNSPYLLGMTVNDIGAGAPCDGNLSVTITNNNTSNVYVDSY